MTDKELVDHCRALGYTEINIIVFRYYQTGQLPVKDRIRLLRFMDNLEMVEILS